MLLHKELSEEILDAYYEVYHELGYGFLEKVYQNALFLELKERRLTVVPQKPCPVYYKSKQVGEYFCDMLVNNIIILELKACECIREEHEVQLLNYLKASNIELGFVLNFGKKPEFSRKICSNAFKGKS